MFVEDSTHRVDAVITLAHIQLRVKTREELKDVEEFTLLIVSALTVLASLCYIVIFVCVFLNYAYCYKTKTKY